MSIFGTDSSAPAPEANPAIETNEIGAVDQTQPEAVTKKEEAKPEEESKFAAKFAALTRKDKILKEREKMLSQKEQSLEARIKELEAKLAGEQKPEAKPEDIRLRLRKDPFNTLKEHGLDYETLTKMALNDGKPTPELEMQLMREELEASFNEKYGSLAKKLEEYENKEAERQKKAQEEEESRAVTGFKSEIGALIEADKENFELLAAEGQLGIDLVYEHIAKDVAQKQEELGDEFSAEHIMSKEEAARQVEEQLFNEAKKRVELRKIKGLFSPAEKKTEVPTKPELKGKEPSPTLSNDTSQVQTTGKRHMSEEEVMMEAARALRYSR